MIIGVSIPESQRIRLIAFDSNRVAATQKFSSKSVDCKLGRERLDHAAAWNALTAHPCAFRVVGQFEI